MPSPPALLLLDSIGYIAQPGFRIADRLIVSGSHGGSAAALYIVNHAERPRLAVFNDAGLGKNNAGIAGLAMLEAIGVAACTYSHWSACIGEARDGLEHGLISHCNARALQAGIAVGMTVRESLDCL
jgi:hypothetical protein